MQKSFNNPCPVSSFSHSSSDVELNTWVEHSVQSEIARGRTLQEQKSQSSGRSNSLFNKSLKLAKGGTNERRPSAKWNNRRLRAKSPIAKNARMSLSTSRDGTGSFRSYPGPRMDRPACSMRISELAVPSKRQCIASWRANANILPENMINRLKERVADQVPIVKVSDAVNCLKYDKRSSHSRADNVFISSVKRPSRKINKEAMQNRVQAENQLLSDAFGIKIAQLLMRPMDITLNSQLQNISNIISEEIYSVIKNKKTFKTDKATNKRMVREISEKVTIWIGKILEDSTEKLLEEELKVAKIINRPMITTGRLVTLIEITTHEESELEEQEGPVLDILDDIIDNILHKCVKTPSDNVTPDFLSICSSDNDNKDKAADRHSTDEKTLQSDEIIVDEHFYSGETTEISPNKASDEDTIENDIKNQLNKVIDSLNHDNSDISVAKLDETRENQPNNEEKPDVKYEPDIDILYSKDTQLLLPDENNYDGQNTPANDDMSDTPDLNILHEKENIIVSEIEENSLLLPSVNEVTGFPISQNQNTDDNNLNDDIPVEPDEIKIVDDDVENETDANDEQTSNVSDAIEIITDGLSEEKNKKVTFSNENLDHMKEKEQLHPKDRVNLHSEEQLLGSITSYERPNIDFAPPNDHLLSDADESWPDNAPVTKPSASVTRSISSMGRILESDEKMSIAVEDDRVPKLFPENIISLHSSQEYPVETNETKPNSILTTITDSLKDNNEQQVVKSPQQRHEDLKYPNETNKIILHKPDEEHSSKQLIEVMQTDGSSLIVKNTFKLPTSTEFENQIICFVQPKQNISDDCTQKDKSVIVVANEINDLEDSRSKVKPKAINASPPPFVTMLSKWQKYDNSLSRKEDVSQCRSKSFEHSDEGTVYGQIKQKHDNFERMSSKKFDYRVCLETAPAWLRSGQGDPSGSPCACSPFHYPDKIKEREREILKWCKDLDFILLKLDKWKNWLNDISKYITTLTHKAALYNVGRNSAAGKLKLSGTEKDATWSKLNQRAKGGLLLRRQEIDKFKIPPPVKYCTTCGRTKSNRIRKHRQGSQSRNVTDEAKWKRLLKSECLNRNRQDIST